MDDNSELFKEVEAAADEIVLAVNKLLASWEDKESPAPTLFHFTDCDGLVGILTKKTVWASLATSLIDASETKYAISRLRSNLEAGSIPLKHLNRELLLKHSAERHSRRDYRAYVCSFCGAAEAVHWLHYGRSGTGVAVGFDSIGLYAVNQFALSSVIYDLKEQDTLLSAVIRLVDERAGQFASYVDTVGEFFAEVAVSYLRLAAPRMKDPSFRSENEWRLFSTEAWVPDGRADDPTRKTHFRVTNGRIVPYKEIKFEELPLRVIELGASSPMKESEQSLAVLMENTLGRTFPVVRSAVPVRP